LVILGGGELKVPAHVGDLDLDRALVTFGLEGSLPSSARWTASKIPHPRSSSSA
jgi:hypothetical protein